MKSKYIIYTFILGFIAVFTLGFKSAKNFFYPEQVNWATHYKGKPNNSSPFFALTTMVWNYSYESTLYRNRVEIKLKNNVSIDKAKSWVKWDKIKDSDASKRLLHHEQGHVNIQYILLNEAEAQLQNRSYSPKTFRQDIANKAKEISAFFDDLQNRYDEETEHGLNRKAQQEWDKYIEEGLESYRQ